MFSWRNISLRLLPMKGHFFLFNAGIVTFVPYLPTYLSQLGFSPKTVGFIFFVLPLTGLFAKPLIGAAADKLQIQKSLFIFFQAVCILSFGAIYIIPAAPITSNVELDCVDGVTMLRSSYENNTSFAKQIKELSYENGTSNCKINCDMKSPKMWNTISDKWSIQEYHYGDKRELKFNSVINEVKYDKPCIYMSSKNITLDDRNYYPACYNGTGYVNVDETCTLECTNENFTSPINEIYKMTCLNDLLAFNLCDPDASLLSNIDYLKEAYCNVTCDLKESEPWRLMEICKGWKAESSQTCEQKTEGGDEFPERLLFNGTIYLTKVKSINNSFYLQLHDVILPSGGIYYPNCHSREDYQMSSSLYHTPCEIGCDHQKLNQMLHDLSPIYLDKSSFQYTPMLIFMAMNWIGMAIVVTFGDAICFHLLGDQIYCYGKQRVWGSIGWGVFAFITGYLIDSTSDGQTKNYAAALILMFIFLIADILVSSFISVKPIKMSFDLCNDLGTLFSSLLHFIFVLWTILVGICNALLWQYLFIYLQDLSPHSPNSKTLQGLVTAVQTFAGEIPFMFMSGPIVQYCGHQNIMCITLFIYAIRFLLYSILSNPWFVLPIEILQGFTTGLVYPTMVSYANSISRSGYSTTMQGLVGAINEGIGVALGSWIGGIIYEKIGGRLMFRQFGYIFLIIFFTFYVVLFIMKRRSEGCHHPQERRSVSFDLLLDNSFMLEDMD